MFLVRLHNNEGSFLDIPCLSEKAAWEISKYLEDNLIKYDNFKYVEVISVDDKDSILSVAKDWLSFG